MCVAEEIQKARLEKREADLKEKAKDYMYVSRHKSRHISTFSKYFLEECIFRKTYLTPFWRHI